MTYKVEIIRQKGQHLSGNFNFLTHYNLSPNHNQHYEIKCNSVR